MIARNNIYRGVVVYNQDPKVMGRVKIYVPGIYPIQFKNKWQKLPWAQPALMIGGGNWTNQRYVDSQYTFQQHSKQLSSIMLQEDIAQFQNEQTVKTKNSGKLTGRPLIYNLQAPPMQYQPMLQLVNSCFTGGQIMLSNWVDNMPAIAECSPLFNGKSKQLIGDGNKELILSGAVFNNFRQNTPDNYWDFVKAFVTSQNTQQETQENSQQCYEIQGYVFKYNLSYSNMTQIQYYFPETAPVIQFLMQRPIFVSRIKKYESPQFFIKKQNRPAEKGKHLNAQTGWCSVPHAGKYATDGASVWLFFQAGDINKPIYFASSQSGAGWFSQHPNQHVFKSDNITMRIDQNPQRIQSTCHFSSYNTNCIHYQNPDSSSPRFMMNTLMDIQIYNPYQNAINLQINGNVNMMVSGDWYIDHTGDKYQTHIGNTYINHKGNTFIQRTGHTNQHLISGNTKYYIDNGDLDFYRHGNTSALIEGNHDIDITGNQKIQINGNIQFQRYGNQNIKISGDIQFERTGNQKISQFGDLDFSRNGSQELNYCGDITGQVSGNRKYTIHGSQTRIVDLNVTEVFSGNFTKTVNGITKLTSTIVNWAASVVNYI